MLQNNEIYTASTNGRSWAHIRHILIENNKNEGNDMAKDKPKFYGSTLARNASAKNIQQKTVL